ncbi:MULTISPECIES: o-succinylbenzoate--CoA ligase [Bacillus]|uniref:2-succinylbenzoate--CoA ligase n=1 Tax=Bacillus pseudomycoides TaxID=64104 RepID=A0AAJ1YWZ7_9BACI|nr:MULTISPECIES: o-succinylbenzoate--CoA ligase [Bacillus cereus group]KFN14495.1 O-succinylbenzoate-CoA ligase [Bacillus pseudomycoides]MBD5799498.1 o-succinylbenzoate--CoA ligase [Bacillus pseudomycoides]MBJ8028004.1 o-succinylbenzoate--CoA ligase [Bacillus cereus group sp. N21]MCR8857423.1 o-succinylbenzoate--CoA ligase [Bacillus pseudomycoides]MDR4189090.1 o-succinylbenzoate--CoA ligase [Bacillus pseudomycoides]
METMPNWLMQRSFLTPERTAIETKEEKITFLELHEKVGSICEHLSYLQIEKGQKVAVLMKNGTQMITVIHALSYIGAVAVLLNTRLSREELLWQMDDAEVVCLVTDQEFETEQVLVYAFEEVVNGPKKTAVVQEEFSLEESMTIIYTSGTTGKPKGVILTYGNHWASAVGSSLNLGLRDDDCWLACMPMFHVGGLSLLMKNIMYGMRILLVPKYDPDFIHEAIKTRGITIISVVSKMLMDLLERLGKETYPSSLRCMLLGGGPAPKPLLETCVTKGIPVYQTYGMTETSSQICTLSADYMLTKVGSAGKPLFSCQLRIEKDGEVVPPNVEGEIVVKGPNVTHGYFKREDATRETIIDGWLHTGDLGYLDEEGFLYVLDRRSDLIISGGENIYPAQIEEVLLANPKVVEAGVVGKADEQWGQVPAAFIVKAADITEEELIKFCEEKLARYKVPREVHFLLELPRNASKKLLRRELRHLLEEM